MSDGTRAKSAVVTVFVQQANIPFVFITTSFTGKIDPLKQLAIKGYVNLPAAANCVWSVNDSAVDLSSSSLSSFAQELPKGLSHVTLTLNSNTLTPGASLSFTLTATGTTRYNYSIFRLLTSSSESF